MVYNAVVLLPPLNLIVVVLAAIFVSKVDRILGIPSFFVALPAMLPPILAVYYVFARLRPMGSNRNSAT